MTTVTTTPGVRQWALPLKPLHMIGIAVIALALVLGYFGLQSSFRPYTTSIKEAMASGRSVQLSGFPGGDIKYDQAGNFTFALQDSTGAKVTVIYSKSKPANFEQAVSIVAIGRYDTSKNAFMADDMLVKCPSKYQEEQAAKAS